MIESIEWTTEYEHADNIQTMNEYLDSMNMLDITHVDGTYAEGVNCKGEKYGIHAGGNGSFYSHRITFELIERDPQ